MNAVVIGVGVIGGALVSELRRCGHCVTTITRHEHSSFSTNLSSYDIVFLCIPSCGDGGQAYHYIAQAVAAKKPVVICEKAALAWQFKRFLPYQHLLGVNASVGGGSYLLNSIRTDIPIQHIEGVINATLNFLCTAKGSMEQRIDSAITQHLCERPEASTFTLINKEICDVVLKLCIIFNSAKLGFCTPADITLLCYDGASVLSNIQSNQYRFVVSIARKKAAIEHLCISGQVDDWYLEAGFTLQEQFPQIDVSMEWNCLSTTYSNGNQVIARGLGAGVVPTMEAMMRDASLLLGYKINP